MGVEGCLGERPAKRLGCVGRREQLSRAELALRGGGFLDGPCALSPLSPWQAPGPGPQPPLTQRPHSAPGLQRRRLIPAPMPDTAALGRKPSLPGQWVDLPPPLAGSLKEPFEIKVYEIDDVERLQRHRPPPREDPAEVRAGGAWGPGGGWGSEVLGGQGGPLGVWPSSQLTSPSPLALSPPRMWRR